MFPLRRGLLLLLVGTLILVVLNGCGKVAKVYTETSYEAAIDGVTDSAVLAGIYAEYLTHTTDTELAAKIHLDWFFMDEDAARAKINELAELNPDSPHYIYLKSRFLETAEEKVTAGRRALALDLKFAQGYLLIGGTYNQALFSGRGNEEDKLWLERQLEEDSPIFHQAVLIAPKSEWAWANLYGLQKYHDNWEEALVILLKGKEMKAGFAADWYIASARVELQQYDEALQEFVEGAAKAVADEEIEEVEKAEYIFVRYAALMERNRQWSRLEAYVRDQAGWETNPDYLLVLAGSQAVQLDMDTALAHLQTAADNGFDSIIDLEGVTGIDTYAADSRYLAIREKVQSNWDEGRPERTAETLAGKIYRPAPGWTLANAAGDSISLADLKGQIVILDFWATWCSPCRMAMPVISNWMKSEMPEGVRVFSVNVRENNPAAASSFITTNDYAMELLYGSNEMVEAYGVEGIPYICVIDGEGQVRFEEIGFSNALGEKLGVWVEYLKH